MTRTAPEWGRAARLFDWRERAACSGMDTNRFYTDGRPTLEMLAVCGGCSVATECLNFALDTPAEQDYGLWGGTTRNERRRLRSARHAPELGASA